MPEFIEIASRGGAASAFFMLSLAFLRDGRSRPVAWLGAAFTLSAACRSLSAQVDFSGWGYAAALPLILISSGAGVTFWLFTRALFDDGFRMKALDWAALGGMMALGAAWLASAWSDRPAYPMRIPFQVGEILFAASALWAAWSGRGNDLVEPRRRARIAFVTLTGAFIIVVTTSYLAPGKAPQIITDLNVMGLLVVAFGLGLTVLGLRHADMFGTVVNQPREPLHKQTHNALGMSACADAAERRLFAKLRRLMEEDRVYREEGLTIGVLAVRLGVPEYSLRRLINQCLGYRNFNAYLNGWRIAEAKAALVDPSQFSVPVSTIALDAGFSSLGPFNRAFKGAEGITPSEYRQQIRSDRMRARELMSVETLDSKSG